MNVRVSVKRTEVWRKMGEGKGRRLWKSRSRGERKEERRKREWSD